MGVSPLVHRAAGREIVSSEGLELHVFHDIDDVNPAEWDALVPPDAIQISHRFIRCCQRSGVENALYRHVLVYRDDTPVAVASFSRMVVSLDVLATGTMKRLIRTAQRVRRGFLNLPVLLCGLPVSFGQPCIAFRADADTGRIVRALAWLMERVAEETDTRFLCWKEFDDDACEALRELESMGYFRAASLPFYTLPLRWRTFEEYARDMRAGYRRQLESTLSAGRRAGLRTRREGEFSSHAPALFALYEEVIERARYRLERLNRPFFEALARMPGGESHALLMQHEGRLAAAAIVLNAQRRATFLLTGIDYAVQRALPLYENLVTEVVRDAIASGAEELEMGQTSAPLKSRLGAVESRRHLFLRHRSRTAHRVLRMLAPLLFPDTTFPARRVFARENAAPDPSRA